MSAKLNSSKMIYKGKVFSFFSDNVTLSNGLTTNIDVIRHPGASAIVPFLNYNEIILIKQFRYAAGGFIWEIPAGVLSPGEAPLECAKRELIEETGYSAGKMEKLTEILPVPGYSDERIHIFLATGLSESKQNLDDDEILKVHTLKLDTVMEMIGSGEITDSKTISGVCLASRFLAHR
ncbi:NUDIX hydrolase [Desulfobacterium sp. N47]